MKSRAALYEALESRQLMSLTIDVRAADGGKSVAVSSVGQVVDLQVWATVTGKNGAASQDGLQDVLGSFLSSEFGAASVAGNLNATNLAVFNSHSAAGAVQDLNGDGNLDVGSNTFGKSAFFFAHADSIQGSASPSAVVVGGSLEFHIADLTYAVTNLHAGGETDIAFRPPTPGAGNITAVWKEDGVFANDNKAVFRAGTPLVVTDPAFAPPPVASDLAVTVASSASTKLNVLAVDTSAVSLDPASVLISTGASHGTAVVQSDGSILYTPAAGYIGPDAFTYSVADIDGHRSNSGTVTLNVVKTVPPVAGSFNAKVVANGSLDINELASDSATSPRTIDPTSVAITTAPSHGTAVVQTDGTILYTPATGYSGADAVDYTVRDTGGVVSNIGTISISVVSGPPTVQNGLVTIFFNHAETFGLGQFETAAPGATLSPTPAFVGQPSHGTTAVQSDGQVLYTPTAGFSGMDFFSFVAQDTDGQTSAQGTIEMFVLPPGPKAVNDSAQARLNQPVNINVLANDVAGSFPVNPASVQVATMAAHGSTVVQSDGSIQYTPAAGFLGTDSFTYIVKDGNGSPSNPATVTVTVTEQLTGTVTGTPGSYHNLGNTIRKVFDGNLSTYFDAPTANGNWVGLDLGSQFNVTQINYAPRAGWATRMVHGMFQASNDPTFTIGVVGLASVASTPAAGTFTSVSISNPGAFRYVRYLSPANSYGNVAELQFVGLPASKAVTQLTGTVIGTAGSYLNQGNTIANVFDGNLSTFFDGPTASGDWAGLDLGSAKSISQISFAPRSGFAQRMVGGLFQASNSANFSTGVVNLYQVAAAPAANVLTTVAVNVTGTYRYVRYLGPVNSSGNVAEVVFFG